MQFQFLIWLDTIGGGGGNIFFSVFGGHLNPCWLNVLSEYLRVQVFESICAGTRRAFRDAPCTAAQCSLWGCAGWLATGCILRIRAEIAPPPACWPDCPCSSCNAASLRELARQTRANRWGRNAKTFKLDYSKGDARSITGTSLVIGKVVATAPNTTGNFGYTNAVVLEETHGASFRQCWIKIAVFKTAKTVAKMF